MKVQLENGAGVGGGSKTGRIFPASHFFFPVFLLSKAAASPNFDFCRKRVSY
jgi:hypothetical protein